MRGRRKNVPFAIPDIAEGMCGRCEYWRPAGDDEGGDCRMLSISHAKGGRVQWKLPLLTERTVGPLVRAVYDRTMAADDGLYWTEDGGGEVVPAEDFADVPRVYFDDDGERKKIWSPLRTFAWFACSRHRAKALPNITKNITTTDGQLSLFGDAA